jgi:Ca2+-transporting ATPase
MQRQLLESPWARPAQDVLLATGGSPHGLTPEEARQRLAAYGPNALTAKGRESWYVLFLKQFANPLVYMLMGAAGIKAYFKGLVDAAVIGAVLVFMAIIGFAQEMKARKAMVALLNLSAPKAKVRRGGRTSLLEAAELVPGDVLILEAGDRVAADARLLEAANLKINESAFTGESLPVEKEIHPVPPDAALHDRINMVFMGTSVSHGRAIGVITATGMQTEIGRITRAISEVEKDRTPLQRSIEKLGQALIWVVSGACVMLAVAGLLHHMEWIDVLLLAVAAAVSGIPEGLPAAVTVVLAICVSRMASRNVITRRLAAVETLGSATVICSDKTGTLTVNQMTVRQIWVGGRHLQVTGNGYEPKGEFLHDRLQVDPRQDADLMRLLRISALCNDAILNGNAAGWSILGDPTEGALLAAAGKAGLCKAELEETQPRLAEIPFESERQFMATLHPEDGRRTAYVKGSVERLLTLCASLRTPQGDISLDASARRTVLEANRAMADGALRVIGIAAASYPVELGKLDPHKISGRLVLVGLAGMIDPPREEARRAIQSCRQAGIRVVMITGDNPYTAAAIASQLGICPPTEPALVGHEIEAMTDEQLLTACHVRSVFARIEPLHKLRIVKAFNKDGHVTAMTGDGVNDAPALEAAGIGVAMGITGTDVAKEASDMVLADDNFASIVAAVEEGRIVFNRLRNVTFFLLMTCCTELLILFLSVAFYGEAPLEPVQILWINLVTGAMVAIPLGLEPGTGDEMLQPPREKGVGLVYPGMLLRLGFTALSASLPVVWIFHHAPLPAGVDAVAAHEVRQTIAFTAIVIFEWFFAFQARSAEKGVLRIGLFRNPWLGICMVLGLGLQALVVYLPLAKEIFHTRPLTPEELPWMLLPAVIGVTLESLRKSLAPQLFDRGQWRLSGRQRPPRGEGSKVEGLNI